MFKSSIDLDASFERIHDAPAPIATNTAAVVPKSAQHTPQSVFDQDPSTADWEHDPTNFRDFCESKEHMGLLPKDWKPGKEGALSERQYADCMAVLGEDPKKVFDPATRKYTFGALLWSKGCISGDTLLFDEISKKSYTIREIVENKLSISVKVYDEKNNRIIIKKVDNAFSKGISKRVKITFKSGKTIIVAPGHRFYDGKQWVLVSDILNKKGGFKIATEKIKNK